MKRLNVWTIAIVVIACACLLMAGGLGFFSALANSPPVPAAQQQVTAAVATPAPASSVSTLMTTVLGSNVEMNSPGSEAAATSAALQQIALFTTSYAAPIGSSTMTDLLNNARNDIVPASAASILPANKASPPAPFSWLVVLYIVGISTAAAALSYTGGRVRRRASITQEGPEHQRFNDRTLITAATATIKNFTAKLSAAIATLLPAASAPILSKNCI